MPIRFGATILQTTPFPALRDDFVFAESIGLDNAWVIDQFRLDGAPEVPLLEAWTALAALATATDRIRIGSLVTNVAMRNPGLLAKSALTVDQISTGRLDVAVGAGYYQSEHEDLGVDFLDPAGRSTRLREVVETLDHALRGETVTIDGEHVRLNEVIFRPHPTQQPRPPLWVAAQGPKALRTAAMFADVVVTLGEHGEGIERSLPTFRARMEQLDEMCVAIGRDPASLRRCYYGGWASEPIFGSLDTTADLIGRYAEAGATDFSFFLANPDDRDADPVVASHRMATRDVFERVASEVLPAFRG